MTILRRLTAVSAMLAAMVGAAMSVGGAWASASPNDGASDVSPGCQYELSSPELVMLPGGARAVRASLVPTTCAPSAQPTDVMVCLAPPHGNGDCKKTPGWSRAEVLVPAQPANGTFTASGKGCWQDILNAFRSACRTTEPFSLTI